MAVVHLRDVLLHGVGDDLFGGIDRSLGGHDLRAKDVDLRLVDAVESGVKRKLVEGLEIDGRARANRRGNDDAYEHRQQKLPVVGDAPDDNSC